MSNPPDPNELLKLLIKQQQERQQQQQGYHQQLAPQRGILPHTSQGNATQVPHGTAQGLSHVFSGTGANNSNLLGNLVDYLKNPGGLTPAAPAGLTSLLMNQSAHTMPSSNLTAPDNANQQQLLALSKLLNAQSQGTMQQNNQPLQQLQQHGIPSQRQDQQPPFPTQQQLNIQQQGLASYVPKEKPPYVAPPLPPINNGVAQGIPPTDNNMRNQILSPQAPGQSMPAPAMPSQSMALPIGQTNGTLSSSHNQVPGQSPPESVSLLTLQTWNLEQLESHARKLEESNQPIPNIVKILLDDARHREEKRHAKRISNRKSATVSRARKRQLIDELTADNARLRRQALILSYLPDPVIAIGLDGEIKFCNIQVARVLKHKMENLEGASILDALVPESRPAMRRLIQDLAIAEQIAAAGGGITDSGSVERTSAAGAGVTDGGSGENGGGNNSGGSTNAISRSSDQSFTVKEVNVNGNEENASDSSGDPSRKKNVSDGSRFETSSSDEPPAKKSKTAVNGDLNVDDVMGASVTANNAGAKLSSLAHRPEKEKTKDDRKRSAEEMQKQDEEPHIHRKHVLAPRTASSATAQKQDSQSSSSTGSDAERRAGVNSSEDSGYMEDSNSNESSDDNLEYAGDSSSLSRNSVSRGTRRRPLAPGCFVGMICSDLTTLWCELTSSIRTRTHNDEDSELGIIDHNPKPVQKGMDGEEEEEPKPQKELLLCMRPIRKGEKVAESLRFPNQISESSASEGKEGSDFDAEAPSSNPQPSAVAAVDGDGMQVENKA